MTKLNELFDKIVQKRLGIETLETQHSDSLDFHDISVWALREALTEAFSAGVEFAYQMKRLSKGIDHE